MSEQKEELIKAIINMKDVDSLEKLHIFLTGMLAQESIQSKKETA